MGKGFLSDLMDKIEDKEVNFSINLDDVEIKLPFSEKTIVRFGGGFKLDRLRLGWGKKKRKTGERESH